MTSLAENPRLFPITPLEFFGALGVTYHSVLFKSPKSLFLVLLHLSPVSSYAIPLYVFIPCMMFLDSGLVFMSSLISLHFTSSISTTSNVFRD